jgi:hypothetical protein
MTTSLQFLTSHLHEICQFHPPNVLEPNWWTTQVACTLFYLATYSWALFLYSDAFHSDLQASRCPAPTVFNYAAFTLATSALYTTSYVC